MSKKKIIRHVPNAGLRAGWSVDCVLTRSGDIEVRKMYVGPREGLDPEDLINLISGTVAASVMLSIRDPLERMLAKSRLINLLDERIVRDDAKPPEPEKAAAEAKPADTEGEAETKEIENGRT